MVIQGVLTYERMPSPLWNFQLSGTSKGVACITGDATITRDGVSWRGPQERERCGATKLMVCSTKRPMESARS